MNRTNIEFVTLPEAPSVSSGDRIPDVRLTSVDVRTDVTTKLEHVTIETRLISESFECVMGDCVI